MLGREVLSSPSMANIKIAQAVGGVGRLVKVSRRVTRVDNMVDVWRMPGNLGTSGDNARMSFGGRDDDPGFSDSIV